MFTSELSESAMIGSNGDGNVEFNFIAPLFDGLYGKISPIKFETVWTRKDPLTETEPNTPDKSDVDCTMLVSVTDSFAGDNGMGLTKRDLILDHTECRPGYTRLIPVKPCVWMKNVKEGLNGKVYLKQLHMRKTKEKQNTRLLAFKCWWPEAASKWLNRERKHGWPPESLITKIKATACRVVPLSHPFSAEKDIEWKFCFDLAAKILAKEATSKIQRSCFQLFWLLINHCLGSQSKLSYSHLKTVFFCTCERIDQTTWDREPASCVSEMVHYLTDCLETRFLPCYYVNTNNTVDDFSDSDLTYHADRLKHLQNNILAHVYFMLDKKGQIVANLFSVFDEIISDFQRYTAHMDVNRSIEECFLPNIVQYTSSHASPKLYSRLLDIVIEVSAELETTFSYKITVKDLLLKIVQTLSLEKGWLCAFFVDQKLHLALTDRVCEGLTRVSLLDYVGTDILDYITAVGDDIKVPEELATIDNIATLVNDFTKLLKDDLALGVMVYVKAWRFFLDMHLNSLVEFIHSKDCKVYPEKRQMTSLQLSNAKLTMKVEMEKLHGNELRYKVKELESQLAFLE